MKVKRDSGCDTDQTVEPDTPMPLSAISLDDEQQSPVVLEDGAEAVGPTLGLSWLRVVFRLLLNAQIPSIRKTFLVKLLT